MPRFNPNIRDEYARALRVVCPFCDAAPGEPCWTRRPHVYETITVAVTPHKARIKASWEHHRHTTVKS